MISINRLSDLAKEDTGSGCESLSVETDQPQHTHSRTILTVRSSPGRACAWHELNVNVDGAHLLLLRLAALPTAVLRRHVRLRRERERCQHAHSLRSTAPAISGKVSKVTTYVPVAAKHCDLGFRTFTLLSSCRGRSSLLTQHQTWRTLLRCNTVSRGPLAT